MICPFCGNYFTVVQDSREIENGTVRKRRRKCTKCGKAFQTHEMRVEHDDKRISKANI
jgi:transcriptional regulator NrdR family protein